MRNHYPHKHNHQLLCETVPSLRYQEGEDFFKWQETARTKLAQLLGLPFERCDPEFQLDYVQDKGPYTDTRFSFQSEKGYYVPCHLLQPKTLDPQKPVFICLQGHTTGMHVSLGIEKNPVDKEDSVDVDAAYALEALNRGYCVILLEQRNFGECGGNEQGPDCYLSTMTALLLGRTTIGERVWDAQRMIDVLEANFPDLNLEKLACLGLSGGGTATTYISCLEPRIKYIVVAGALCTFKHSIAAMYHCSCNYVPKIAEYFDMGDLGGLFAPRKFLDVAGDVDPIFPVEGVMEAYHQIEKQYQAANAPDACKMLVGHGPHRFFNKEAWDIIDSFFKD